MNTDPTGASPLHRRPEPPPLRLRGEWSVPVSAPSPAAEHDFLVPNPRPDLTAGPALAARLEHVERRSVIEPDSIFWCPESHAGDAA